MKGGESVRVAFRNPPFHPAATMPLLLRILGLPQAVKSTLSSVTGLQRFAPNLAPDLSRALCSSSLARTAWWSGKTGRGGRRSGVVSGELGSSRAPSLTGGVVSFLSQ